MKIESNKIQKYKGQTKNRNDLFIKAMKNKNCFSKNKKCLKIHLEKGLLNLKTILSIKKSLIKKKLFIYRYLFK